MKSRTIFSGIQLNLFAFFAGAICLTMSAGIAAQESKPCVEDAAKFCKGVEKGQGRIALCMKEHEKELSAACKENIAEAKVKIRDFSDACKEDMQKNCKDTKLGGGRILQCLKQHEATLSPACKEKMAQGKRGQ